MSATFYVIERKYQRKPVALSLGSFCLLLKTNEIFGSVVQIEKLGAKGLSNIDRKTMGIPFSIGLR
jgi:hypothetical protein